MTYDATDSVVGLARTLRAAGVDAGPERVHAMVLALDLLDPAVRSDVYWAGRVTLCSRREDLEIYDRAFRAFWEDVSRQSLKPPKTRISVSMADLESEEIPTSYVPFRNANMLSIATSCPVSGVL